MLEYLKVILLGIVEGITEWLPISSTGHMILVDEFIKLGVRSEFKKVFEVVIQLGAIMAVVVIYWNKLWPFHRKQERKESWFANSCEGDIGQKLQQFADHYIDMGKIVLWLKIVVAIIPAMIFGLLFDDWMDAHFYNYVVVAITLIVYGIAFLFVERENSHRRAYANSVYDIDLKTALLIGCFQCLSLIPGTSRSGSTILGAIILGVGRAAGAEFSFFLAIPTMLGASVLKLVKFLLSGVSATGAEWAILAVGCVVSFVVSLLVIKGLMEYVRKHSFAVFGVYRIILGVLVLGYFAFQTLHA